MGSAALNTRFEIADGVISEEVQLGETLLLNTRTLAYFGLDALGSRMWRAMQHTRDTAEVIRVVAGETGLDPARVAQTLEAILQAMARSGLVTIDNAHPQKG